MLTYIIITIVTGIALGFAASAMTPGDGIEDLTRNMLVGAAGAFVGLQIVGRIFTSADAGASMLALAIASIAGATVLLFVVNRVRSA